jgi:hypothetical protein
LAKLSAPFLTLFVLLVAAAPASAASPIWPQPEHYDAQLRYDRGAQVLSGVERISFVNDGPRALSAVWLRVWPNGYGSCKRRWARVTIASGGHLAGSRAGCTALRVLLSRTVAAGRAGALRVRLRVKVPRAANRFGQDRGVVYLGNALPLLDVQASSGPALNPYTDLGDPFYSRVAAWSVQLDVPVGLTAATTGELKSRRSLGRRFKRLHIEAPQARDFAIVLGRLRVETATTSGGVVLRRYRLPNQRRSRARAVLRVARAAVQRYTSWYGPPGERQIDLVPGPGAFGSGMEYPGLVQTPDDPQVVTHELAHQWWYGLVGDDQWSSPWLDESFAEFSSRRLPDSVVHSDRLRCNLSNPVRPFGQLPLTASMTRWDRHSGWYYSEVYLGGTCALRSLEHDLGPGAMSTFLRSYVQAHRWGIVTTADFVDSLRRFAPTGYDVDGFLRRARITPP